MQFLWVVRLLLLVYPRKVGAHQGDGLKEAWPREGREPGALANVVAATLVTTSQGSAPGVAGQLTWNTPAFLGEAQKKWPPTCSPSAIVRLGEGQPLSRGDWTFPLSFSSLSLSPPPSQKRQSWILCSCSKRDRGSTPRRIVSVCAHSIHWKILMNF